MHYENKLEGRIKKLVRDNNEYQECLLTYLLESRICRHPVDVGWAKATRKKLWYNSIEGS